MEKGKKEDVNKISYKVGWCHNQTEVPKDYSGEFTFYGLNRLTYDGARQYLYFKKRDNE